ncbi:class I glutamine amidotransferase-like protein [Crepidotus variabilis]|uniref:Class I glutamine amidotransferase-like protein n=1 Tax=Crepidotus variabilis TaxID=179855 RepID=A0A9P6EIN0_9AGAR|nr:class I glutamine amidotransferase-like protein [Crepidotus variabilis]
MTDQKTLSFGVLLLPNFQLLDAVGPTDFINTHSQQYFSLAEGLVPASLVAKAPSIEWHYISHSLEPVQASSFPAQHPTTTFKDCPKLDYLIIPGPDPTKPLPEGCAEWLKNTFEKDLKGLLLVCTGSMVVAGSTDILNGRNVATNKLALKMVASTPHYETLKKVKWVGDKRWVIDGKIWSAAGVTAGIDLAVEFVKRTFHPEVVELAKNLVEYTGKPDTPDEFAFLVEGVAL